MNLFDQFAAAISAHETDNIFSVRDELIASIFTRSTAPFVWIDVGACLLRFARAKGADADYVASLFFFSDGVGPFVLRHDVRHQISDAFIAIRERFDDRAPKAGIHRSYDFVRAVLLGEAP